MTDKIEIGINQRIPISILELALTATLEDRASADYFASLASSEYNGQNRIHKAVTVINRLTVRNKLLPFMKEHKADLLSAIRSNYDRPLVFAAVICAAYNFAYDAVSILGKYFHVQPQVSSTLIIEKMSAKYGANRSLPNGLYCVFTRLNAWSASRTSLKISIEKRFSCITPIIRRTMILRRIHSLNF